MLYLTKSSPHCMLAVLVLCTWQLVTGQEHDIRQDDQFGNSRRDIRQDDQFGNSRRDIRQDDQSGNSRRDIRQDDQFGNSRRGRENQVDSAGITRQISNFRSNKTTRFRSNRTTIFRSNRPDKTPNPVKRDTLALDLNVHLKKSINQTDDDEKVVYNDKENKGQLRNLAKTESNTLGYLVATSVVLFAACALYNCCCRERSRRRNKTLYNVSDIDIGQPSLRCGEKNATTSGNGQLSPRSGENPAATSRNGQPSLRCGENPAATSRNGQPSLRCGETPTTTTDASAYEPKGNVSSTDV